MTNIHEDQNQALAAYLSSLLTGGDAIDGAFDAAPPAPLRTASVTPTVATPIDTDRIRYFAFTVCGLKLALPIDAVASVADHTQLRAAASSPLVLGVVDHGGVDIPVLDIAQIAMPGKRAATAYEYIVLLKNGRCGLACHSVEPILDVMPADVVWKTDRTSRPWLAGTMMQHRCAILDQREIERML